MGWALQRFQHHAAAGGVRYGMARGVSRLLGMIAGSLHRNSQRLVRPSSASACLPGDIAALLAGNSPLRNLFAGERALIIGSGPSARLIDEALTADRRIIAVNEMFGTVRASGLHLAAIVVHDPIYFDGSPDMDRMLHDAAAAARDDGALLVVPAFAARRLVDAGLVTPGRLLAFFESGCPIPALPRPARIPNFTQAVPSLQTVSHAAVAAALHLGFREIGLIGIDLTYVAAPQRPILHGYGRNPYYDPINRKTAADAYASGHGWDWPAVLRDVATQLEAFAWLADAALGDDRRLVNLAPESLLATVPGIVQGPVQ